jgi:hypothetical protein
VSYLVDAGRPITVPQENPRGGGDHYVNSRSFGASARPTNTGTGRPFARGRRLFALLHHSKNDMCRFPKQELFAMLTF